MPVLVRVQPRKEKPVAASRGSPKQEGFLFLLPSDLLPVPPIGRTYQKGSWEMFAVSQPQWYRAEFKRVGLVLRQVNTAHWLINIQV